MGRLCLVVLLVVAAAGCGPALPDTGDRDGFVGQVAATVPDLLAELAVPGAAIALIEDGEVWWTAGFGVSDQATGAPVTAGTTFRVASISKPVTAWAVMRLAELGLIDLDAPVGSYLSRWRLPASEFDADGVTVRRLLSHTAGTSVSYLNFFPEPTPTPELEQLLAGTGSEEGPVRLVAAPGAGFRYSGGGFTILELLVEEATGEPFAAWVENEVLIPLGMRGSTFDQRPELAGLAAGHGTDGEPVSSYRYAGVAGAGLFSTAADLGTFVAAAMPGPDNEPPGREILRPETVALMLTSIVDDPQAGIGQGLGYFLDARSGTVVAGHAGSDLGWNAKILFLPDNGRGIVILTNGDGGADLHVRIGCQWAAWASSQTIAQVCP